MDGFLLLTDYFVWHYGRALRDFFAIGRDLLWFGYHFFSLPALTRTLFAPFSRIRAEGFSILEIEASLQNLTANAISRVIGFCLRIIVIAAGVLFEIALSILLAAAFLIWLLLPLALCGLLAVSAGLII